MTIQQLEYFLSAAKTLNFTKTGKSFFISQSAVTQQIHNLEEELHVSLFYRHNKKISLTPAGKMFIPEAEALISRTKQAVERVRSIQSGKIGTLCIGYLQCMEMSNFPQSIQNFHKRFPQVRLELKRDNAVSLYDEFLREKYDIIFNVEHPMLIYPSHTQIRTLRPYHYYVALLPDHPLSQKKLILQEDLMPENLIIHDFQRGLLGTSELLPPGYLREDIAKNVIATADDVETILLMVAAGTGIAVIPDFDIAYPRINLDLNYIPLDIENFVPHLQICYEKENPNPLLPFFLEEI